MILFSENQLLRNILIKKGLHLMMLYFLDLKKKLINQIYLGSGQKIILKYVNTHLILKNATILLVVCLNVMRRQPFFLQKMMDFFYLLQKEKMDILLTQSMHFNTMTKLRFQNMIEVARQFHKNYTNAYAVMSVASIFRL